MAEIFFRNPCGTGCSRIGLDLKGAVRIAVAAAVLLLAGCGTFPFGAPPEVVEEPPTKAELVEIQQILTAKGYAPGPVDGLPGPRTSRAISRYQSDAGLVIDGEPSKSLLAHLKQSKIVRSGPRPAGQTQPQEVVMTRLEPGDVVSDYESGDTFVFSDGVANTVVRVGAERVTWRGSNGDTFVSLRGIGLPMLDWESGEWRGRADVLHGPPNTWPPADGQAQTFDVRTEEWNASDGDDAPRFTSEVRWTCRSEGRREVGVPAGRFQATVIACERSPVPAGDWQRRVWYYLPEVRQPLRRDDIDSSGAKLASVELVAALPGARDWPPLARAGLQWATNDALSNKSVGERAQWRSTAISEQFEIRITGAKKGEGGQECRNYVLVRTGTDRRRLYPGLACRKPGDVEWHTPGLANGAIQTGGMPPRPG